MLRAVVPSGWETLLTEGERLVVATRRLEERDLRLALLARDDVAFGAFPSDAVVLVVGGDRFVAKYTLGEASRSTSGGAEVVRGGVVGSPGPEYALGEEKVLPGGVRVRRGDVPRSGVLLASYAGPTASTLVGPRRSQSRRACACSGTPALYLHRPPDIRASMPVSQRCRRTG